MSSVENSLNGNRIIYPDIAIVAPESVVPLTPDQAEFFSSHRIDLNGYVLRDKAKFPTQLRSSMDMTLTTFIVKGMLAKGENTKHITRNVGLTPNTVHTPSVLTELNLRGNIYTTLFAEAIQRESVIRRAKAENSEVSVKQISVPNLYTFSDADLLEAHIQPTDLKSLKQRLSSYLTEMTQWVDYNHEYISLFRKSLQQ